MRSIPLLTVGFIALSACQPVSPDAVAQLRAPVIDGGSYSTGGGITVAAEIQEIGGRTALCGVWAESKRQSVLSKGRAPQVMGSGSAYLGGEVLQRGLLFMRKVDPAEIYEGMQGNCVVTGQPWQGAQPVQIRIPRQIVHREDDDIDGAGPIVLFRQTGPGA
jgi:hypothetical protein